MARPQLYTEDDMLDAAAELLSEDGPTALSMAGVAARIGAPSGSIYHRFRTRDELVASLWLRTVERFQESWFAATEDDDPRVAVRRGAAHVLHWSRAHPVEARLLLLYRSSDLLGGDWPAELQQRNRQQLARINDALGDLARRLSVRTSADRRRLRFALFDIPYGAVRGPLARGRSPERQLDQLVDDAVVGVIERIPARRPRRSS